MEANPAPSVWYGQGRRKLFTREDFMIAVPLVPKIRQNCGIQFGNRAQALLLSAGVMGILEQGGVDSNSLCKPIH